MRKNKLSATAPYSAIKKTSHPTSRHSIAAIAAHCLKLELRTWPKPGLVSHIDNGSHNDMDAGIFYKSILAIAPHLERLALAGAQGAAMDRLRVIGLEAEQDMFLATGGVNAHRGAIFGLGLLCAAAGAREAELFPSAAPLGAVVADLWGQGIAQGPILLHSHGQKARRCFGSGGARAEAFLGFPSVYNIGVPALRIGAAQAPCDWQAQRVFACFSLIAELEDTNLLHRGGEEGLRFAQEQARRFLNDGGVAHRNWRARAAAIHQDFIQRGLSPGGGADLLAMSLFVEAFEKQCVRERYPFNGFPLDG